MHLIFSMTYFNIIPLLLLFVWSLPTNISYACLNSPICVTCSAHPILPNLTAIIISENDYKLQNSSLHDCLNVSAPSTLQSPNIFLSIFSSNTLSLCSSLRVNDQVSHTKAQLMKFCLCYF